MKSILIIEDDPRIVTALEVRLKATGYRTVSVGDAASGLSKAVTTQPDLVVLDVSLPAGDGLQVAQKLRSLPETRGIPVVFVTASKEPGLRAKVMDLGAAGFFEKPYDAEELIAVIGHALGETGFFRRPIARYAPETESVSFSGGGSAKKILIVEDDRKIAMALALRFKSAGYDTTLAYDALSGVSTAARLCPDLVLLDISMPAGNGFSVAERVKGTAAKPTPIIFLTASKQPGFRERAMELGAAGYFEKPYEAEDLLAAVHRQIGA